ncbi:MAG: ribonuclease P protein component [Gammaproteobacteria bacterium]|nr:MAG: ribonuclease P protein component [Gammaproteobacteria bacterium]
MRLLNSNDFQTVFDDAPLRTSHQHFLFLARQNQLDRPRLGLVIAKKHIRHAVDRNRMKRLIRETFRAKQQQLAGIDVIVLARKGMHETTNLVLIEQLNKQWQGLIRKYQKALVEQARITDTASQVSTS